MRGKFKTFISKHAHTITLLIVKLTFWLMAITFLIIGGNIVLFKNEEAEFQLLKSTKQQKQSPVVLVLKHFIVDFKLHSYLHDRNNGLLISSVRRSHNYCLVFL